MMRGHMAYGQDHYPSEIQTSIILKTFERKIKEIKGESKKVKVFKIIQIKKMLLKTARVWKPRIQGKIKEKMRTSAENMVSQFPYLANFQKESKQ